MPWNEFLLPILAGYILINSLFLTRFRAQRLDNYRLLIESMFAGVIVYSIARVLAVWIQSNRRIMEIAQWLNERGVAYPHAGTAILAAGVALFLALIVNLVIRKDRAKRILVARNDNGFLRLFHEAIAENRMVSVSLSSKKVYIGYVLRTPNLSPQEQFVGLLPVVSGYRDKDTLRLVPTTDYGPAISSGVTPANDFEITFALSSIESANLFDPKAYPLFDQPNIPQGANPQSRVAI